MTPSQVGILEGKWIAFPPWDMHEAQAKGIGAKMKLGWWTLPISVANANMVLRRLPGIDVSRTLNETILHQPHGFQLRYGVEANRMRAEKKLYEHQAIALNYALSNPHTNSIMSLSMGLGKTAVSIALAQMLEATDVLFICSSELIYNWYEEIERWSGRTPTIIYRQDAPKQRGWYITNYENVWRHVESFDRRWDLVAADESVLLKQRKSKRTKAIQDVAKSAQRVILLSGSPITKFYDDLWSQLHIIAPSHFPSYWRFTNEYCNTWDTNWGTQVVGNKRGIDPTDEFRDFMLTIGEDEAPDLPNSIFRNYSVQLTAKQSELYAQALEEFMIDLSSYGEDVLQIPMKLAQLTRLQQIVSNVGNLANTDESAKADLILKLLEDNDIPLPAIIWMNYRASAEQLAERLQAETKLKVGLMMGGHKAGIQEFKAKQLDVLIMTFSVGKFGHNLQMARSMVYHDRTYDADHYIQSLKRVRRPGLAHRPHIITLHAPKTTDALIEHVLSTKLKSIATVTKADIVELLGGFHGRKRT